MCFVLNDEEVVYCVLVAVLSCVHRTVQCGA